MRRRDPLADPRALVERLYAYVAYQIGDGPDAEDVTSDAFERALRYRSSYDPRRGSPASWLIGIARRCLADRAAQRVELTATGELEEQPAGPHDETAAAVTLTVRAIVAQLPDRDRELVALRYGADLTAREIGELLDLQTNAVEVALHRLHRKLRGELTTALERGTGVDLTRKGFGTAGGM
ncbi:MAG TPA: sigma-70 family RNA polymerase sigma factor [Gaiellaceae bacterium]|nr:sigma-70 family RNA polymerase sigma factor [Gaiellaceae bacterium]